MRRVKLNKKIKRIKVEVWKILEDKAWIGLLKAVQRSKIFHDSTINLIRFLFFNNIHFKPLENTKLFFG